MVMVSEHEVEDKVRDYLWSIVKEADLKDYITNPHLLQDKAIKEKDGLYEKQIKELNDEIKRLEDVIKDEVSTHKPGEKLNDLALHNYREASNERNELKSKRKTLETTYKNIVKSFVDEELKPLSNLKKIVDAEDIPDYDDSWIDKKAEEIINSGYRKGYEQEKYIGKLKDHILANTYNALKDKVKEETKVELNIVISELFGVGEEKERKRKEALEAVKSIDLEAIGKEAREDLNSVKTAKEADFNKAKDEYKANVKNIKKVLDTDLKYLLDEVNFLASEVGTARLKDGEKAKIDAIKKHPTYEKLSDALLAKEVKEQKWDFEGTLYDFEVAYIGIKAGTLWSAKMHQSVTLDEKVRRKYIKELNAIKEIVKTRVDDQLPEFLDTVYTVISNSKFDKTPLTTEDKKYIALDKTGKLAKEWTDGVRASMGLEDIYQLYYGELVDKMVGPDILTNMKYHGIRAGEIAVEHTPQFLKDGAKKIGDKVGKYVPFLKKMGSFVKKKLPTKPSEEEMAPKKVKVRKPAINGAKLGKKIVDAHKSTSWGNFKKIEIDDIAYYAGYLAAEDVGLYEIASAWEGVDSLKQNSTLDEIINKYSKAAEVTDKVNRGIARRTQVVGTEFKWMDNHINQKAGFLFYAEDKVVDAVGSLFGTAHLGDAAIKKSNVEDLYKDWKIRDTAIKPKSPLLTALGLAGGTVGAYALIREALSGNAVKEAGNIKESGASFHIYEILKEVGISFATILAVLGARKAGA